MIGPAQNTDEWRAWRFDGIGASEVWEALTDPASLYYRKVHRLDSEPADPAAAQWGHDVERAILDNLGRRMGWRISEPVSFSHPERPWLRASLDGAVFDGDAVLGPVDAKNRIGFAARDFGDDGDDAAEGTCPPALRCQIMHQVYVLRAAWGADVRQGWVAACIGGRPPIGLRVEYDAELYEGRIVPALDALWQRIERRDPPPPSGTQRCTEAIGAAFPNARDETVTLADDAAALVEAYQTAQAEAKVATERQQELRNRLCVALGDVQRGLAGDWRVSWASCKGRPSVDVEALKRDHPDIYQAVVRRGDTYRRFSVAAVRRKGTK
ncbi:MAG: YqaJ viral recombinase family protein [Gemmatimonadales bacterium]|nr:YqaJ viral recombinase family protein [Gemmatimonadales bacterium]